ncbi:MAG: type II toxin-antitoxin system VapC family toxin [Solirubrobacterales bacterium]
MIVVDTSAVVDALTGVPGCDELRSHLAGEELHAPALLDFEFVCALRGLTLAGRVSATRANDALIDFDALPIYRWEAGPSLRRRAYSLRDNLTAYDAAYVALAEALECQMVTRDARLARSSGHAVPIVVR